MDLRSFNVLSLCTGVGGLDIGLKLAVPTARVVCMAEREGYCCEVLATRMEEGSLEASPIWTDIRTFDGKPWRGLVDCIVGGYPCFAAGTLVLTRAGYRPIETITVGDEVLTHLGRWRPVTAVMSRNNANLRRVAGGGVPGIVTTDEHPFYTRELGKVWDNEKRRYIRSFSLPEWTEARSVRKSGHFIGQVLPNVGTDNHTESFWWLVGRYLADGWRQGRKSRGNGLRQCRQPSGRVNICCNFKETDELRKRIKAAGFHAYEVGQRTAMRFAITNGAFWRFLKDFGKGAAGKSLPGFVFELDKERATALLDGYLSGDGHREKEGEYRATTVSRRLALSIVLLAQRAYGVVAGVRLCKVPAKKQIEGRTVNQRPFYIVSIPHRNRSAFIDGDYGWKLVRKNEPAGVGTVYNIAVSEDESYVAEGAIVHNCQPFSVVGKRKGADDPRHLWPHIVRIIGEVQPSVCFFENVGNHLRMGFEQVHDDLRSLGYRVAAGLFTAEEVGAPHKRERLFILARRHELDDAKGWEQWLQWQSEPTATTGQTATWRPIGRPECDVAGTPGQERGRDRQRQRNGDTVDDCFPSVAERPSGASRIFPPGPNNFSQWQRILQEYPEFAPAISEEEAKSLFHGVADGLANRVDRLRACGNGVVPLQAAYGFYVLSRALQRS